MGVSAGQHDKRRTQKKIEQVVASVSIVTRISTNSMDNGGNAEYSETCDQHTKHQDCPKKVISAGQNRSLFVFAANLRFLGLPEN